MVDLFAILRQGNLLSNEQLLQLKDIPSKDLLRHVLDKKIISENEIAELCAKFYGCEYIPVETLQTYLYTQTLYEYFDDDKDVLTFFLENKEILLIIGDPHDLEYSQKLAFKYNTKINIAFGGYTSILKILNAKRAGEHFTRISTLPPAESTSLSETPIVAFLQHLLNDAVFKGASDIHLEPQEFHLRIRYRIDGLLKEITEIPPSQAIMINSRLKIMADLDIAEKRRPQDGRFTFQRNAQNKLDCRISTCPTQYGEKIVIRLLALQQEALSLDQLGIEQKYLEIFRNALKQSSGIILVTGPTGSGKTITLYAALLSLNQPEINIATIEDPIEVRIPGINQSNIHPKINFTFAKALRTLLRQDPDIIMIGEIRDEETAQIALRAAQTGHLVLATLHTNNAEETIARLVHLGMQKHYVTRYINLIIAQRLIRVFCPHCKRERSHCMYCNDGYLGRTGLFEFAWFQSPNGAFICPQTLHDDALQKVRQKVTSMAEIQRVLGTLHVSNAA